MDKHENHREEEEEEEKDEESLDGVNEQTERNNAMDEAVAVKPQSTTANKTFTGRLDCGGTAVIKRVLCPDPESLVPDEIVDEMHDTALFDPEDEEDEVGLDTPTEASDLRNMQRRIWVVTTAALPWRTGTAVNPLLRALYLTRGRPKHYVTLVVPWMDDEQSRIKLYGPTNSFSQGGQAEQEAWIRNFCRERANCEEEEALLRIMFYPAAYHEAFGSIFPSIDICSMIPNEEADVAILEEPEHLNWFRVPEELAKKEVSGDDVENSTPVDEVSNEEKNSDNETKEEAEDTSENVEAKDDTTGSGENGETSDAVPAGTKDALDNADNGDIKGNVGRETQDEIKEEVNKVKAELGWAHKFRHVVGILHTNYSAYMTQYAVGTSFIAAPAISMLSSIVVRAYCHRVIRLSATLPSLAPNKEVTCNVHGVRSEFLLPALPTNDDEKPSAVYFIGKLIWAKGFDKVLEVQDLFRKRTGSYFAFDIYGGGKDERAIARAFFGRNPSKKNENGAPSDNVADASCSTDDKAAILFSRSDSLREQVEKKEAEEVNSLDAALRSQEDTREEDEPSTLTNDTAGTSHLPRPLAIIGDLSVKSVATAVATSQAVYSLADSIVGAGLKMTITRESKTPKGTEPKQWEHETSFFDPPQSRFEWRRNPIPARFLGVKDHALLRDVCEHKVFLNMSTTEVLCTTTSEALAMGKFAVIPDHPSNGFFKQFPNCLSYTTLEECVDQLQFALQNEPTPLTNEMAYKFTWEGAKERLFDAAAITKRETMERIRSGAEEADKEVCWWHVQGAKRGQFITSFFAPKHQSGN